MNYPDTASTWNQTNPLKSPTVNSRFQGPTGRGYSRGFRGFRAGHTNVSSSGSFASRGSFSTNTRHQHELFPNLTAAPKTEASYSNAPSVQSTQSTPLSYASALSASKHPMHVELPFDAIPSVENMKSRKKQRPPKLKTEPVISSTPIASGSNTPKSCRSKPHHVKLDSNSSPANGHASTTSKPVPSTLSSNISKGEQQQHDPDTKWIHVSEKHKRGILPVTPSKLVVGTPKKKSTSRSRKRACSTSMLPRPSVKTPSPSPIKRVNVTRELPIMDFVLTSPNSSRTSVKQTQNIGALQKINEFKPIGKVRETPKVKRLSRLKQAIRKERTERNIKRASSAPGLLRNEKEEDVTHKDLEIQLPEAQVPCVTNETTIALVSPEPVIRNKEQNKLIAGMLGQLSQFQDRAYAKFATSPYLRKRGKRLVCGIREVIKCLRLKILHMVLIASDLEGGASKFCNQLSKEGDLVTLEKASLSSLQQILIEIWQLAASDPITPIFLVCRRRDLAMLCRKPGRVSVVGVCSLAGAEEVSNQLLSLKSAINLPPVMTCPSFDSSMETNSVMPSSSGNGDVSLVAESNVVEKQLWHRDLLVLKEVDMADPEEAKNPEEYDWEVCSWDRITNSPDALITPSIPAGSS